MDNDGENDNVLDIQFEEKVDLSLDIDEAEFLVLFMGVPANDNDKS